MHTYCSFVWIALSKTTIFQYYISDFHRIFNIITWNWIEYIKTYFCECWVSCLIEMFFCFIILSLILDFSEFAYFSTDSNWINMRWYCKAPIDDSSCSITSMNCHFCPESIKVNQIKCCKYSLHATMHINLSLTIIFELFCFSDWLHSVSIWKIRNQHR